MVTRTRAPGRPPRGISEVGRTLLLDRTREAMRTRPKIDLQRQEIATHAGVTPALVTYYFPDKWDLFVAAAKPVVNVYISEVRSIIGSEAAPRSRLLSLITLILRFNFEQGYLLDFYVESSRRTDKGENIQELGKAFEEMQAFFGELLRDGLVRGENPAFIHSSFWGLCRYLAHQQHLSQCDATAEIEGMLREIAASVCDLFLNGAATAEAASRRGSTPSSEEDADRDVPFPVFQARDGAGDAGWVPRGRFGGVESFLPV